jgi:hypothetical protein
LLQILSDFEEYNYQEELKIAYLKNAGFLCCATLIISKEQTLVKKSFENRRRT